MNPECDTDTLYTVTVNRRRVEPSEVCLDDVTLCLVNPESKTTTCAKVCTADAYNVWCAATLEVFLDKLRQHVHHLSHDYFECSKRGDSAIGTMTQYNAEYDFEEGLGTLVFGHRVPEDLEMASSKYDFKRLLERHNHYDDDPIDLSLSISCEDSDACRPPDPFLMRQKEPMEWWHASRKTSKRKKKKKKSTSRRTNTGTTVYSMNVYIKPQSFRRRDFVKFEKRHYPLQAARRAKKTRRIEHLRDSGYMDDDTADRLIDRR